MKELHSTIKGSKIPNVTEVTDDFKKKHYEWDALLLLLAAVFHKFCYLKKNLNEVHSKSEVLLMSIEDFRIKTPLHTGTGKNIINKIIS